MLLATFHGGSGGETNVLAFDTSSGQLLTSALLSLPPNGELDELRTIVAANGYLYVADGGTTTSSVLCYQLASTSPPSAALVATLLTATFLDGTYVASQNGSLRHVHVTAPNVPATRGGLGVPMLAPVTAWTTVRRTCSLSMAACW